MNLDWHSVTPTTYSTTTPDGRLIELALNDDDDGWYVTSDLPELDGIGYLGEDIFGAMHLTANLLRPAYQVRSWTIHGGNKTIVPWDQDSALDDEPGPDTTPAAARWWGKVLRRAEPE